MSRRVRARLGAAALGVATVAACATGASAQLTVGAGATGLLTRVDPTPGDRALTEARLVQPVLTARWLTLDGILAVVATLNAEGATMPGGELAPGNWGEGFFDRRHPHTWAHELLVTGLAHWGSPRWPLAASFTAGKGFVPFGTDDPMNRPAVRYPVNHHLAQLLERAVAAVGLRSGPLVLEGALFNGDEPERPGQWPNWERFGDSWSVRLTARPLPQLEAQASFASVASPEFRNGAGPEQEKWSGSLRWAGPVTGGRGYAMVEWARTEEVSGTFTFRSLLAEAEWSRGPHRAYYRAERTDRPEEERTLNRFRAVRPHLDNSILGITRWTIHTAGYGWHAGRPGGVALEPVVELGLARVARVGGGVFDPELWYGRDRIVSLSVGLRAHWGTHGPGHRMGRHGVVRTLDERDHAH